jgi:predicted permease
LLERVRQLPGVQAASLAVIPPLSYAKTQLKVEVDGYQPRSGESFILEHNIISTDYFETLAIPILQGRPIDERDQKESAPVLIVNETMARKFWGAESPLDRMVTLNGNKTCVVGVAKDGKYFQLAEAPQPHFYVPLSQAHVSFTSLLVKGAGDPRALIGPVLRELERLDPNLPITDVKTLAQQMEIQHYPTRITAVIVGAFGLLALALATVGVYGVMAYTVRQRTHELGVRTALGASHRQVMVLVLWQGLGTTLVGAAVGIAGAVGAARLLAGFLHGVSSLEPVVLAAVAALLGVAAMLACYLPARRAAKVDPMVALRQE